MKLRKIISILVAMTIFASTMSAVPVFAEGSVGVPYYQNFDDMTDEDLSSADEWQMKTDATIVDVSEISSETNVNGVMQGKALKLAAGDKAIRINFDTLGIQEGQKWIVEFDMLQETLSATRDSHRIMFSGGAYPSGYTSMIWTMLNNWLVIRNKAGAGNVHRSRHYKIVMDIASVNAAKFEYAVKDNSNSWTLTYSDTIDITTFFEDFGISFLSYDYPLYIDNFNVYEEFEIKASANTPKGGIVNGSGQYRGGEEVSVIAIPNEGYEFLGWYEGEGLVSTDETYTFTVDCSRELVANFKNPNPKYTVSAASEDEQKGAANGGGTYAENAEITLTATPKAGYKFVGWYDAEGCASTENPWSFASIEEIDGKEYTAKFDNSQYLAAIAVLNEKLEAEDKEGFKTAFDEALFEMLSFGTSYEADVNLEDVAEFLYGELSKADALVLGEDAEAEQSLYGAAVAAVMLNENKDIAVFDMLGGIISADEEMKGFYDLHIKNGNAEEFLGEVMKKENTSEKISDMEDLIDALKCGLVLSGVEYPNGYGSIKDLFEAYKEVLGLKSVSKTTSVWKGLANDKTIYKTTEDLHDRYEELVEASEKKTSSGGGGGGGSSTGSGGKPIVNSNVSIPKVEIGGIAEETKTENKKETIELKFIDLNSVPWAYSAIARMVDSKVINGYSETEFRPESTVTREQFVKMLVCAMNLSVGGADEAFDDVSEGDWHRAYIAAAVKCGIVSGKGDGTFGVGEEITRQDMAVMAYKAAVYKGLTSKNAELSFSDGDAVADYAKQAVAELSALGVINGTGDGKFEPVSVATRAEAAVIIDNIFAFLR